MIRYIHIILLIVLTSSLAHAQQSGTKGAAITFAQMSHDFGDISQGQKVDKAYSFTNSGTEPLVISEVVTTCGCTATKWSKEPIQPGQSGEIAVTFNSEGKEGRQNKVITVISNASNSPSRINLVTNVLVGNK